jgi:hypothetical protein
LGQLAAQARLLRQKIAYRGDFSRFPLVTGGVGGYSGGVEALDALTLPLNAKPQMS